MSGARWSRRAAGAPALIVAHRGASKDALENTLEAFRAARAQGADGVELDAMLSADGQVVVFHDDDLGRLAAGRRERVAELPLAALREVKLAGKHGAGAIPTLDEVLDELGDEMLVNVELKTPEDLRAPGATGLELAEAAARLLARRGKTPRFLVSSFNPVCLGRFKLAAPTIRLGLLFHLEQPAPLRMGLARHVLRPMAVHPDARLVDVESVARWHGERLAVNVWTVDDLAELRRLDTLGVDAIITNRPRESRAALVPDQ